MNAKEKYLSQCSLALQEKFGTSSITVKIIAPSLNGAAWFDALVNTEVEITGIDLDAIPKRYITKNGDAIPFACAELRPINNLVHTSLCPCKFIGGAADGKIIEIDSGVNYVSVPVLPSTPPVFDGSGTDPAERFGLEFQFYKRSGRAEFTYDGKAQT